MMLKIPNITNLATSTALTAVEIKIPDHNKYVTSPTAETFAAKTARVNLGSKSDIDYSVNRF